MVSNQNKVFYVGFENWLWRLTKYAFLLVERLELVLGILNVYVEYLQEMNFMFPFKSCVHNFFNDFAAISC